MELYCNCMHIFKKASLSMNANENIAVLLFYTFYANFVCKKGQPTVHCEFFGNLLKLCARAEGGAGGGEQGWRLCFPLWHVLHACSPEKINIAYAQHVASCHCRRSVMLSVCECVRVCVCACYRLTVYITVVPMCVSVCVLCVCTHGPRATLPAGKVKVVCDKSANTNATHAQIHAYSHTHTHIHIGMCVCILIVVFVKHSNCLNTFALCLFF